MNTYLITATRTSVEKFFVDAKSIEDARDRASGMEVGDIHEEDWVLSEAASAPNQILDVEEVMELQGEFEFVEFIDGLGEGVYGNSEDGFEVDENV